MGLRLINRSGYDDEDLRRFVRRGLSACGVRGAVECTCVASPIRSRGCAEVGGKRMVLAIAAPSRTSKKEFLRRLARLFEHEAAHLRGLEHHKMDRDLLYSRGPTPDWARGTKLRYVGRAGDQMAALRGEQGRGVKVSKRKKRART